MWIKIKDNLINLEQVCYIKHKKLDLEIHYQVNHLWIRFDTEQELQHVVHKLQVQIEYVIAQNINEFN